MEKIKSLIDGLSRKGEWQEKNAEALRKRPRAVKALHAAVLRHASPEVREGCAELLGEFDDTTAVPECMPWHLEGLTTKAYRATRGILLI